MSSFIVSDSTINRVVNYLGKDRDLDYTRSEIKKRFGFDLETEKGKEQLGQFMFNMNVKATSQRYNGDRIEDFRSLIYKYVYMNTFTKYDALKSLSCWLYQCLEGDVAESEDYKFFQNLRGDIAYIIVSQNALFETSNCWE